MQLDDPVECTSGGDIFSLSNSAFTGFPSGMNSLCTMPWRVEKKLATLS
jgi:hypothetical protein